MKKFFVPLFFVLLLSCSNEDFKPDGKAASEQKYNRCYVESSHSYYESISESLCKEMDGEPGKFCPVDVCTIPGGEISSSSRITSSSSGGTGSSSSSITSSSSGGTSSSSSGGVSSSSSVGGSSSSSSSVSSSSGIVPPTLSDCSPFPYYVATTKRESIKNMVSLEGNTSECGNGISYTLTQSSSSIASLVQTGDSIRFTTATTSERNLTITAKATCGNRDLSINCPIKVIVADNFAKIETCHNPRVSIGPGRTAVEISCVNDDSTPAQTFGCDCPDKDTPSQEDWTSSNMFSLNGNKAQGSGCWATVPITPDSLKTKAIKRVLIENSKGVGCVAY